MTLLRRPAAAAIAGLLLAATATAGTASAATLTASASVLPSTTAATVPAAAPAAASVVNARFGVHPGYTRIVLDVHGKLPGVKVTRVAKLVYDASGKPVPLHGAYYLRITLTPAVEHNAKGASVYHGPKLTTLRLPHVKGFALIGDFEGVVSFGAALSDRGPIHVFTLTSPNRIVIDVS